jgi:hypothetical protein
MSNDKLSNMKSAVRFEFTSSLRFIADELRRYGVKTKQKNNNDLTIFFQSAHVVCDFINTKPASDDEGMSVVYPTYALVSFKDLFKIIGKNPEGADTTDIDRVAEIAELLEDRNMIRILDELPQPTTNRASVTHIYSKDKDIDKYTFKSKFASNKMYETNIGCRLIGMVDFFALV